MVIICDMVSVYHSNIFDISFMSYRVDRWDIILDTFFRLVCCHALLQNKVIIRAHTRPRNTNVRSL